MRELKAMALIRFNLEIGRSSRLTGATMRQFLIVLILFASSLLFTTPTKGQDSQEQLVSQWLEKQATIKTWSADFTQTRTLKSFAQPLKSDGQLWFAAPNQFRWELGKQTIAVRHQDEMRIFYPKLKRVEKYPLASNEMGQWREALSLLEAGFPRSRKDLEGQFKINNVKVSNNVAELSMEPRTSSARRMMPQIKIAFSTEDFQLRATELHFADGSIMRNDFRNPVVNEKIDPGLFTPNIPPDFKVIEPTKKK